MPHHIHSGTTKLVDPPAISVYGRDQFKFYLAKIYMTEVRWPLPKYQKYEVTASRNLILQTCHSKFKNYHFVERSVKTTK